MEASRSMHDLEDASPRRVQAFFDEEVAAQEAMGLLAFHGFRTDGIVLRAAAGTQWRLLRPRRRPVAGGTRRGPALGAAGGIVVAAVVLVVAGVRPTDPLAVLGLLGAALVGAVLGLASRPTTAAAETRQTPDVMVPVRGCVVAVRTLRTDEARLVLERADGVLVEPVGDDVASTTDADPMGPDGRDHG